MADRPEPESDERAASLYREKQAHELTRALGVELKDGLIVPAWLRGEVGEVHPES